MASFFGPMDDPPFVPDGPFELPPATVPGQSSQRAILYRSESLGVGVFRIESFSTGFSFTLQVEGRGHGAGRFHFLFEPTDSWGAHGHSDDPDPYDRPNQQFRLGLEFADGTTWENFTESRGLGPDVRVVGGSGSGTGCTHRFWVPQLPPPGEFVVHALWPSVGMGECSATFDADEVIAAASDEWPLLA